MSAATPSQRLMISETTRPAFARWARLHEDRARQRHVILAPERAYQLDAISVAVLRLLDGQRSVGDIVRELAAAYAAPAELIARDVLKMLQNLADKRMLRDGPDAKGPAPLSERARAYTPFAQGPAGLLAELTHRCPLQCPYCSNPLEMERAGAEMSADAWGDVFRQAAAAGVLQLHLSGGEPTARRDLPEILAYAVDAGLYTNLITAGVLLTQPSLQRLAEIGLDHVQLSIQDVDAESADRISGYKGGLARKSEVAACVGELGLGLTINAPVHRHNIARLPQIIEFAAANGAQRIEIAHVQYYAWAQKNRAALIPTREAFLETVEIVEAAKARFQGVMAFDFVIHDPYAKFPKACMGGWARSIVAVSPSGLALPCQPAPTLPGLSFDNVREKPFADIWLNGQAFRAFRGEDWMKEPCRTCDRRQIDFGGCRCQAFAITGDAAATDPACHLSDHHESFATSAEREAALPSPAFAYRRM